MQYTLEALAALVDGTVEGDAETIIARASPLTHATTGDITFIEDDRNARKLDETGASAAVVGLGLRSPSRLPLIRVARPFDAFGKIFDLFQPPRAHPVPGIHPLSSVAVSAKLGRDVVVGPYVVIGDDVVIGDRCQLLAGSVIGTGCRLGDDVTLHPRVVLYADSILGDRVTVHAGAVIGADGFGYRPESGGHVKVPQRGCVRIGNDVEIGANTTIDRATFLATEVGDGTKVDNLVQIAHNCRIGRHNLIVSQVGLAGSCRTGDFVVIAGQAGVKDHITIGDGAVLEAMSGVMEHVPAGEKWVGIPATPARDQFRLIGHVRKLPEMRDKLAALARQVEDLEQRFEGRRQSA